MERRVAILRAVNVGGRKLPMAELRALASGLGWTDVATFIQSGNLLFAAPGSATDQEKALEAALRVRGLEVPVIVRTARQWRSLTAANPFRAEAESSPARLLLFVSKEAPAADAAERIAQRAEAGEKVRLAGGALWCHFPEGVGRSKITPAAIDRACGSPTTGRNYRTVTKIAERLS